MTLGLRFRFESRRGLDPECAANSGIDLGSKLAIPEWRARFALPSEKTLDPALLGLLLPTARAVAWTHAVMNDRIAGETSARLPLGVVHDVAKFREAILGLATYHLSPEPVAVPIIADIPQGSGYADLAGRSLLDPPGCGSVPKRCRKIRLIARIPSWSSARPCPSVELH